MTDGRMDNSPNSFKTETRVGTVLVVDDSTLSRLALAHYVKRHSYEAEMAENGRQCLELLRSKKFDLLLLDLGIPELDGYQVLELMKVDPSLRNIPVIMITAEDEQESIHKCFELGACGYLLKPVDPVQLKEKSVTTHVVFC